MNRKRPSKGIADFSITEADIIGAVDQWLSLHRIPHWRINSGALKTPRGDFVRFGAQGMADIYAIGPAPEGKSIWIECKRPKGGAVSEAQREFLAGITERGGIGLVVSSIESLELQLTAAGII